MTFTLKHWLFSAALMSAVAATGAAEPVPAKTFEVGTMLVEQHGSRGTPLVLIPGLGSGAWAWDDTVKRFEGEHVIYVVTLAGFNGRPAVPGPQMAQAQASLLELITSRRLNKPVLIGHSLGGTLSLAFAEQHAGLLRGVVAVDGLPVFPGTEDTPSMQRQQMGDGTAAAMQAMPPAVFIDQQQQYMRGIGVLDMALADDLAKLTIKSDKAAMAAWMGELLAADYRRGLSAISVPVLLISPYSAGDSLQLKISEADKKDYYTSLMAGTPQLDVVSIDDARHFVMFDQPERFGDTLAAWLKKLH